jgi:hypothetical protein
MACRQLLGGAGCAIGREVNWGPRTIDIVLAALPQGVGVRRLGVPKQLARTSTLQVYTLAVIAAWGRASPQLLARLFRTPTSEIAETAIAPLCRSGLVEGTGRNCYRLADWRKYLPERLIAIEAKLDDWRGAVAQARACSDIAECSYVALPTHSAIRALDDRRLFAQDGIGLLSVEGARGMAVLIGAKQRRRRRRELLPWVQRIAVLRDLANGSYKWEHTTCVAR